MDYDYWERMEPSHSPPPCTTFTVYSTQQAGYTQGNRRTIKVDNRRILLDDQEELDSIRGLHRGYARTRNRADDGESGGIEQRQQQQQLSQQPYKYIRMSTPSSTPVPSSSTASSPYHIRDTSFSASSVRPSSTLSSISSGQEAVCAVCGDGHAKLHYGVLACYGCKGFFRRTLTGKYQYVCRFGNNCVVDKHQRNSCRCCRFNRCLEMGMDPKAVRPDRDLTGKQRVPRARKRAMDEELINHMMRLQGDDWSRKIPVDAKMLLMQLINIESKVAKGDSAIGGHHHHHRFASPPPAPPSTEHAIGTSPKNVSLRELFEQKPSLNTRRTEMCYEPYRMARAEELPKIAHRGAIAAVDWVESLAELIDTAMLETADKIALVKACYAPLTIFNFSARTAQNTRNPDILCLCSYSYVPRKLPRDFNGSNHLSNNLIDRTLNELVGPLRKLNLREEEVVPLKAIIILDPNAKQLLPEAQRGVAELRDRVQDMLFQIVKELHPVHNAASRFGNLLLLLPTITTLSGVMCENMQFCQVFGWTDPLLNELFETTQEANASAEDGSSLFGGGTMSGFFSYSPPMLGNSDALCNPADISLHDVPPSTSASQQTALITQRPSVPPSSPSSDSPSSASTSSSKAMPTPEKCEMSTQTEQPQQSAMLVDHFGYPDASQLDSSLDPSDVYSQQNLASSSHAALSPLGGFLNDEELESVIRTQFTMTSSPHHDSQSHQVDTSSAFSAAEEDPLLFEHSVSNEDDLFGFMQ